MSANRLKTFFEIVFVFSVFVLFGAWQCPDVNEAHYIGKAIHFWNPDWVQDDSFLKSKDSHRTFYLVFGWLTFFCTPAAMAWTGRIAAWSLLAWSWQRLSFTLLPVRWAAIPTALALAYYIESFNMAGEWLIGGIEGKSLAYPFVFFALEAIVRNRWNRAGVFLGIASAFHILVGGWTVLIAGVIFVVEKIKSRGSRTAQSPDESPIPEFPWIGIILGGLLALCGLIPALMLDAGVSTEVMRKAHQIYVFDRLPHHLVPYKIKESFLLRFALLTAIWVLLCRPGGQRQRIFNAFVLGTLGVAVIGIILAYSISDKALSADVLRFYWFRLSDIAVPMGVAIGAVKICLTRLEDIQFVSKFSFQKMLSISAVIAAIYMTVNYLCFGYLVMMPFDQGIPWAVTLLICSGVLFYCRPQFAVCRFILYLSVAFYAPFTVLPHYADLRTHSGYCRTETAGPNGKRAGKEWQDMCLWIKEHTPSSAKFWIPRDGHTFKWYAERSDIGTWKNIPQDAESIVAWRQAMNDLFKYKNSEGQNAEDRLITTLVNSKTDEEIVALQQKYGFDYILCAQSYEMPAHAILNKEYENDIYCLYRVVNTDGIKQH